MTWNITYLDTVNTTAEVVVGTNDMVGGLWWIMILFILWTITLMIGAVKKPDRIVDIFIGDSFVVAVFSFISWLMKLTDWKLTLIFLILFAIGLAIKKFSEQ